MTETIETPEKVNIIQEFLSDLIGDHTQFKPGKHFYSKMKLSAHRWNRLYRGDKSPTLIELNDMAAYFGKNITVITDKRQLKLFTVKE